ncbi:MAG: BatA domain-containing protein, partial [Gemmatimonadaceae bacterium]
MIGNPLALLGLLAIAVPVIIHLLGRHRSRIQRFPTLRFLTESRLIPTRRRRVNDIRLLMVRVGIVAAAAIALSQPYFDWTGRSGSSASSATSRAIIVDTSESMRRPTIGGPRAVDSARWLATSLERAGAVTRVIETGDVATTIGGASAWLDTRPGIREIVLISDFQPSVLDDGAVARVPRDVGIKLQMIPASGVVVSARIAVRPTIAATEKHRLGVEMAWAALGQRPPWDGTNITGRVTIRYKDVVLSNDAVREDSLIDVPWM